MDINQIAIELRKRANSKKKGSISARKVINREFKQAVALDCNITLCCPECGSVSYVKNGNGRYKCKDCKHSFRATSGSILKGYDFTYDEWIEIIKCVVHGDEVKIFTGRTGYKMSKNKAWLLRLKIMSAIANIEQPKLTGIVQVDGTFFRESQKASKKLDSFVYKGQTRAPRLQYVPSVSGIIGNEFICCLCGVDNHGIAFAENVCLGQPTYQQLKNCLDRHIETPSFLCSDGHELYEKYCDEYSIPHEVKPSTFDKDKLFNGYVVRSDKYHPDELTKEEEENNRRIVKKMSSLRTGPHLRNSGKANYETYQTILKNRNKDYFGLDNINQFHGELKRNLVKDSNAVSSKYLKLYLAFEVYKHNFRYTHNLKNGEELGTDTELYKLVFEDLIKYYDEKKFKAYMREVVKPTEYNTKATNIANRRLQGMRDNYWAPTRKEAFDGKSDMPNIFNKKKCFKEMNPTRIKWLANYFGIKEKNKEARVVALSTLPNADEIILRELFLMYYASEEEVLDAIHEGYLPKKSFNNSKFNINNIMDYEEVKELRNKKKIIIDCETTGLTDKHEIIELSILDENGNILFNELFHNLYSNWNKKSQEVSGITPEMVANKGWFSSYLNEIQKIINDADVIIGYNVSFDIGFLKRQGILIDKETFDVYEAYCKAYGKGRNTLKSVAKRCGYRGTEFHRSLNDCEATLFLFNKLMNGKKKKK